MYCIIFDKKQDHYGPLKQTQGNILRDFIIVHVA